MGFLRRIWAFFSKSQNEPPAPQVEDPRMPNLQRIVLRFNDELCESKMCTNDGRIAFFTSIGKRGIVVQDLFHLKTRKLRCRGKRAFDFFTVGDKMMMIDNEHALVYNHLNGIALLKLDYKTLNFKALHQVEIHDIRRYEVELVLDQLDNRKFVLYSSRSDFLLGSVDSDRITVGHTIHSDFIRIRFVKLFGRTLYGLQSSGSQWKFCEVNLDTRTLTERTDFTWEREGREELFIEALEPYYIWNEGRLYFVVRNDQQYRLFCFNVDTGNCASTGIVLQNVRFDGFFIDDEEILTMKTTQRDVRKSMLYRFPLRDSDSLLNRIWMTIVRSSSLFGSNIYESVELPQDCHLNCLLPDE